MNLRRTACALALALLAISSSQAVASAVPVSQPTYLLSLGDSLSVGYQAAHDGIPKGDTNEGYADQLYASLHPTQPNLVLVKLGCSGETTATMLNGGICSYPGATSQVDAAVQFLAAHPGQVKYVTNDIGANDVDSCAPGGSIDIPCALGGIATLSVNLPAILSKLRTASGPAPVFVGMNYYNPFLAAYVSPGGSKGLFLAAATSLVEYLINNIEETEYRAFGARIADVSGAFHSLDFFAPAQELPGVGPVPLPVYNICTLTYMCSDANIHANVRGYAVIAIAFLAALTAPPNTL